ncbi:hypothetical protein ACIF83_29120 [Streptomyces sp. NPDC085866]|uniref:SCO2400 family protein n=1 Tax=Streptomyces sp. NPDC085866 TaxID=3365736 RepID=UPI0037D01B7C
MDFCHPCQRHLNGALACPGCGAPAPSLAARADAPVAHGHGGATASPYGQETFTSAAAQHYAGQAAYYPHEAPRVPTQFGAAEAADAYASAGPDGYAYDGADSRTGSHDYAEQDFPDDAHDEAQGDADDAPGEPGGRAARRQSRGRGRGGATGGGEADSGPGAADASRRDRKAAAHRRRRRRTVLIAAGLVLAAGGLSVAELGTDAPFSPFSSDEPATSADTSADGGTSSASPDRTANPLDDVSGAAGKAGASASADASASASASKSPKDKASKSPSATDQAEQSATSGAGGPSAAPTAPATSRPTSTPTADPTTSDPTPLPSPTKTCNRFLWWCT